MLLILELPGHIRVVVLLALEQVGHLLAALSYLGQVVLHAIGFFLGLDHFPRFHAEFVVSVRELALELLDLLEECRLFSVSLVLLLSAQVLNVELLVVLVG